MPPLITIDTVTNEFWQFATRLDAALDPATMSVSLSDRLRQSFLRQIRESFANEADPDGHSWAPLSDWRVEDRQGSEEPILYWTGSLYQEAVNYRGRVRMITSGFSYWFPDFPEMTPRMWGLTAGQIVNPLNATPLSLTPRRMLGSNVRNLQDSIEALVRYFESHGFAVEIE